MIELLSPAGSMEALRAAVQNGADAVYLGTSVFNARIGARNFTLEELAEAVSYCHIRGVKVHLTLNTLALDRELEEVRQTILSAAHAGVDAFIVQDLGIVALCRDLAPEIAVHASTQMSIHSLAGVVAAASLGCSRVVLARELPKTDLKRILRASPIETEVFGHGALCMCYSGQCYFSSIIGRRSGNRGGCAQPCRMAYGYDRYEAKYPLSLKDNCLLAYVQELQEMGVASLKLEGRMKRPEYVAIVTRIYRAAIDGKTITDADVKELEQVFSRDGFTQGYYEGKLGRSMLGTHKQAPEEKAVLARARETYESKELQRVPVDLAVSLQAGQAVHLICRDDNGHEVKLSAGEPERALNHSLTEQKLTERLSKTGGTPYLVRSVHVQMENGLSLPASAINALRRDALDRLTALRGRPPVFHPGHADAISRVPGVFGSPAITVSVRSFEQLTPQLFQAHPSVIYVPIDILCAHPELQQDNLCAALPRIVPDSERDALRAKLKTVWDLGIRQVLIGTLGHIALIRTLRDMPFEIRGDYGLNVFNSYTASIYSALGLCSLTASFELSLPQLRDLSKPIPTEIIAYGRLPLMITENCIIKNRVGTCSCSSPSRLVDRLGEGFPVLKEIGSCRNEIFNSKKLYLLDKLPKESRLGIWAIRLSFTTEHANEVNSVLNELHDGGSFDPGSCTRGLYLRGVE